jgi:jouberin
MSALPPLFKFEDQFKDEKHRKMALSIKVLQTGSLILDPNMIHPFVKIHIVDMDTCKYLAKSKPSDPGVTHKESAGFMDTNRKYTKEKVDYF